LAVIGGRAHINGVTFATNTHVVRGRLTQGTISISVRQLPGIRLFKLMDKVPFLRGVSSLARLNLKLFLEIIFFLAIPWERIFPVSDFNGFDSIWACLAAYIIVLLLLVVLLRRLWQFHEAEHKAFNSYTNGDDLTITSVRTASRISNRCGTNMAVIAIPLAILLSFITMPLPLVVIVLAISYEIFNRNFQKYHFRPIIFIAEFIQKYIVTAEPTEEQILLAAATLSQAIEYS